MYDTTKYEQAMVKISEALNTHKLAMSYKTQLDKLLIDRERIVAVKDQPLKVIQDGQTIDFSGFSEDAKNSIINDIDVAIDEITQQILDLGI